MDFSKQSSGKALPDEIQEVAILFRSQAKPTLKLRARKKSQRLRLHDN